MDKAEIIKTLGEFPYAREDYWLVTGGAMVFYGIKAQTADIDLGCSTKMADALERGGFLCGHTESGGRRFRCGERMEIFENWIRDSAVFVEGFQVVSIRGLIGMKRELGREKDLKDLRLIREWLERTGSGFRADET